MDTIELTDGGLLLYEMKTFSVSNGTLIIMAGTMQKFWKHDVPKTKDNVGERINLTFRKIVKE